MAKPHAGQSESGSSDYVFGTELPRVLLNEAYVQYDNDSTDPGLQNINQANANPPPKASRYKFNAWVELHNPFKTTTAGSNYPSNNGTATAPPVLDGGTAVLQSANPKVTWSNYQLLVVQATGNAVASGTGLNAFSNSTGQPAANTTLITIGGATAAASQAWGTTNTTKQILPANGAIASTVAGKPGGNTGFYVVGPPANVPYLANRNPNLPTPTLASALMSSQQTTSAAFPAPPTALPPVTVMLQRLACPNLAPNLRRATNPSGATPEPHSTRTSPSISCPAFRSTTVAFTLDTARILPGTVPRSRPGTRWAAVSPTPALRPTW